MGHGFSGTQDRLFGSAETFAAADLAALTFDYRNFGESGGKPRQVIDIEGQRADWRAAVSWARSRPEIDPDRVALWGSSLGGTHTIFVAAADPGVAAVVAQIPYAGLPKERVGRRVGRPGTSCGWHSRTASAVGWASARSTFPRSAPQRKARCWWTRTPERSPGP